MISCPDQEILGLCVCSQGNPSTGMMGMMEVSLMRREATSLCVDLLSMQRLLYLVSDDSLTDQISTQSLNTELRSIFQGLHGNVELMSRTGVHEVPSCSLISEC